MPSFSQLRQQAGLSLEQAAAYLSVTPDAVRQLELGAATPSAGAVRALLLEASLRATCVTVPDKTSGEMRNGTECLVNGPTEYADHTGTSYASSVSSEHRKSHGLFLTPVAIAHFTADLISCGLKTISILDPAAGGGVLLCAAVENLLRRQSPPRHIKLSAYEIDTQLCAVLSDNMLFLAKWAANRGTKVECEINRADFVETHGAVLGSIEDLVSGGRAAEAYDVVIANPPYFKLGKSDSRVQAALSVVSGQPNIYALFMAVGAALLKPGGEFIYIVPRSFASGPYFQKFRKAFFKDMRPGQVHVFHSRREAFGRDEVLQENVIVKCVRDNGWVKDQPMIISSSAGLSDINTPTKHPVSISTALDRRSVNAVLRLPASHAEEDMLRLVDGWPCTLDRLGLAISTGPVVPFRAVELIDAQGDIGATHAPLLWMNHVKTMEVTWPLDRRKPEFIKTTPEAAPLLVANKNYVLLRRFSAKEEHRRLVAGPYLSQKFSGRVVGLENHLNYIYRPKGTMSDDEVYGLAALLSCDLLDAYFRISNGNTQVSATELRAMPLPPLNVVTAIGRDARRMSLPWDQLDDLVRSHLSGFSEKPKRAAVG